MTKENYSILDARNLVNDLNNIMVFFTSGCVEENSTIQSELEKLMLDKIEELDQMLLIVSDKS